MDTGISDAEFFDRVVTADGAAAMQSVAKAASAPA